MCRAPLVAARAAAPLLTVRCHRRSPLAARRSPLAACRTRLLLTVPRHFSPSATATLSRHYLLAAAVYTCSIVLPKVPPPLHHPHLGHTCPCLLVSARAFPHQLLFPCLPVPGATTDKWSLRVGQGSMCWARPCPATTQTTVTWGLLCPSCSNRRSLRHPSSHPSSHPCSPPSSNPPSSNPPSSNPPSSSPPSSSPPSSSPPSSSHPCSTALRAAALRAVPACISSSGGGVQCVTLPHPVPHHPPSPQTTACHTDHTHHTRRTCHTHRTSHPPFSHSLCTCHTRHMLSILIILQFSPFSPFSSGGRQDGAADALGL